MRIGVAEVLYPKGHKELDINTINVISDIADVYYFSYRDFLNTERLSKGVEVINLHRQFNFQHVAKLITFSRIVNLLMIKKAMNKNDLTIDSLVLLSFDNSLTKYVSKIFTGLRVYVIHHDDVDKIPETITDEEKVYYNKIHHIVYENYIKEGLVKKTQCEESMIHVVPHPIVFEYRSDRIFKNRKVVLSIGWSNDESLISELISRCKKLNKKLIYKIIIRSKNQSYKDDNLEVISGFLSKEKYESLMKSADLQAVLYPNNFKYRYSATFQTALLQGCYVLVNDVYIGRKLNQMFPNSTHLLSNIEELLSLDETILNRIPNEKDIQLMMIKHGDKNISKVFDRILS